jgi:hypothetical protein
MKCGKAAGLDELTAEHLQYAHPILPCLIAKLFNLVIHYEYVPTAFGVSYTVPLLKGSNASFNKAVTVDDFRGISISPVLSKIFEHCILSRYKDYFITADNQVGFKKSLGCSHALYAVRSIIDSYTSLGSTVNICALDLSKAFDKRNHHGLFNKLMQRKLPSRILGVIENWFSKCFACVRWSSVYSEFSNIDKVVSYPLIYSRCI